MESENVKLMMLRRQRSDRIPYTCVKFSLDNVATQTTKNRSRTVMEASEVDCGWYDEYRRTTDIRVMRPGSQKPVQQQKVEGELGVSLL